MKFYVQIKRFSDSGIEKELGPFSERRADKVDDGVNINLNHDEYFTQIVKKQS